MGCPKLDRRRGFCQRRSHCVWYPMWSCISSSNQAMSKKRGRPEEAPGQLRLGSGFQFLAPLRPPVEVSMRCCRAKQSRQDRNAVAQATQAATIANDLGTKEKVLCPIR
eukprot:930008-Amphidinium_carterae.2